LVRIHHKPQNKNNYEFTVPHKTFHMTYIDNEIKTQPRGSVKVDKLSPKGMVKSKLFVICKN